MIRTPPEHNTKNPPGQIVHADVPPGDPRPRGLYLRDVIKRIQGEEGAQEPMKLPTPIAGPAKALADLKRALLDACDVVEYDGRNQKGIPSLRTALIRRLIKENT